MDDLLKLLNFQPTLALGHYAEGLPIIGVKFFPVHLVERDRDTGEYAEVSPKPLPAIEGPFRRPLWRRVVGCVAKGATRDAP